MDRRKVCRFFERGSCKKQKCPFVHLQQNRKNCEFYMKGFCKKGTNCRFYHPPRQDAQEKEIKKKFKPTIQQNLAKQQEQQSEEERREEFVEQPQKLEIIKNQQVIMDEVFKKHQINMMLGFESDSSDEEQQMKQFPTKNQVVENRRILNFNKVYPKKFPDYSKALDFKERILKNEQKYFNGQKFLDFMGKINEPSQKQFYQIVRKFQDSFTLEDEECLKVYVLNIRPILFEPEIKLHFQMLEDTLEIRVDSRSYPEERAKLSVLNPSIPAEYKGKIEQWLNKNHEKKSIFDVLKLFMNGFEKIYHQCKKKLQDQYFSQLQLESKLQKKLSAENQMREERKLKRKQKNKNKEERIEANPYVQVIPIPATDKLQIGNMNYCLSVGSSMLSNCEYVLVERILVCLVCQCQQQFLHIMESSQKELRIREKLRCKKCQILILLCLEREVMQIRSEKIGQLGIENGRLVEVCGIGWKIGCQCNNELTKNKIYMPGQRMNVNCHLCFKNISVTYMGLKFSNPYFKEGTIVVEGKQLPSKGSCKHMKHSYRWIRYGCCGRTFSCDQCHSNSSLHEKIEGITMICGHCSIEQIVAKNCVHCSREVLRGVDKSGHWEGGLGCRDQTLLSRKDAKKYTGITKKKV